MELCRYFMFSFLLFICLKLTLIGAAPTSTSSLTEEDAGYWHHVAQHELMATLNLKPNFNVAKNVIMFLGDGMGVTTVTAGRILKGQRKGQTGEEGSLTFDNFPHTALVKTYNVDQQTPDSAGTGTAFLCGVKANAGTVGVTAAARRSNCSTEHGTEIKSILKWSQDEGKSVGVVSTARITHATPAASYASSVERNWEGDVQMSGVTGCKDIADQLVTENKDIQVILGGGRCYFIPANYTGEDLGKDATQNRRDGRNLINEWTEDKTSRNLAHAVLSNSRDLKQTNADNVEYVLGLFAKSHMDYEVDRDKTDDGQPSLAEMTELAINVLKKNNKGFFLLVEGGRIDHGHHASQAKRALNEVLALDEAVERAVNLTNQVDTLIVTTADHSHVFTIGGYPSRGNDILGLTDNLGNSSPGDGLPLTTLLYANGPGHTSPRQNLTGVNIHDNDYRQQSAVPKPSETHGGEDVAVYALGPMAHLFQGVHEQNYVAHAMAYASCVGANKDHCKPSVDGPKGTTKAPCTGDASSLTKLSYVTLIIFVITVSQVVPIYRTV